MKEENARLKQSAPAMTGDHAIVYTSPHKKTSASKLGLGMGLTPTQSLGKPGEVSRPRPKFIFSGTGHGRKPDRSDESDSDAAEAAEDIPHLPCMPIIVCKLGGDRP